MAPGTDLEVRRPAAELVDTLIRNDETALAQLKGALPENVSVSKFVSVLQTALIDDAIEQREPGKQLLTADRASLFQAAVKCATDGLLPDRRQAVLIRRGDKVVYQPMIGGARHIAAEFGWTIRTHAVYENDKFEVLEGTEQRIEHKPAPIGADRGAVIGAYAIAHHRDGRTSVSEVYNKKQIEEARAKSAMPNGPAWKNHYPQMAEKTVGHRIAKKLPLDPQDRARLMRVLEATDLGNGEAAELMYGPNGRNDSAEEHVHTSSSTAADSQQAGTAATAASPVPGAEALDEFGGSSDGGDADIQAATVAAGYRVTVPKKDSWVNDLSLAQINARGADGDTFFRWAVSASNTNDELKMHALAYAKVQKPDLYDELGLGEAA